MKTLAGSVVGVGIGGPAYSCLVEPYWLAVERHSLRFASKHNPPCGLRIVHLSDLHRSRIVPDSYLRDCIATANELAPDLVVMTGDYITSSRKWADRLGGLLVPLQATVGVYATLGNHDGGRWAAAHGGSPDTSFVREALEKAGIRVIVNRSLRLKYRDKVITLVGLGDLWAGEFDAPRAFRGVGADEFTIALSHNPDTIRELRKYAVNLILCGHTHGGQVRLPFIGPPILPVDDKQYSAGVYRIGEQVAYVNRGIGLLAKVRFNCRPEIACLDIV